MRGFYASGGNGSYVELEDGRYADSVVGDTSEDVEAHEAVTVLGEMDGIDWVDLNGWKTWSNWDQEQMDINEHVAVDKL